MKLKQKRGGSVMYMRIIDGLLGKDPGPGLNILDIPEKGRGVVLSDKRVLPV